MHDGRTRKVDSLDPERREPFLETHTASLTILRGTAAGMEYPLEARRTILGRSPQVEIRIDDPSVSSQHVAFELGPEGFGLRDLASTNGVQLNGTTVLATLLKHGDRISVGACELQYVIEDRAPSTKAWVVEDQEDGSEEDS